MVLTTGATFHVWSRVRGEGCSGGSKNGHRRDSLPAWISSQPPNEALPSSRATAPDEVHDQRNDGDYQQEVNQPTGNVEREKSQQPQYKRSEEHTSELQSLRHLV